MTAQVNPTEQGLVNALREMHARGRKLLSAALRTLRQGADPAEVARIAATMHHFVTIENPLHELDEEQKVLPALRAYGPKEEVDAALAYLVDEHIAFDALRERLAPRWKQLAEAPGTMNMLRDELFALTGELAGALRRHTAHEELVVFPLVRRYVAPEVQAGILAVISNPERHEAAPEPAAVE